MNQFISPKKQAGPSCKDTTCSIPFCACVISAHKTARRSLQRHQHLQDDDILRITSLPDYDFLIQVIDKVHAQVGAEDTVTEAPSHITPHTCPICQQPFSTLRLMRRHCTVEHGHRSGQLRLLTKHPMSVVPTCQRCGIRFTTWHRYHYHIAFVCMTALQEIDQVEHRLRVQELLQFCTSPSSSGTLPACCGIDVLSSPLCYLWQISFHSYWTHATLERCAHPDLSASSSCPAILLYSC